MGRRSQLGHTVGSQVRQIRVQMSQAGAHILGGPAVTSGLTLQMRVQAQQALLSPGPCPASSSCMPGPWSPKGSHGTFCLGDTPCPKLMGRSCPDVLGTWGAGATPQKRKGRREGPHLLRNLPGVCLTPGSTCEVLAVASNMPSLASLLTTSNTPYPRDRHPEEALECPTA